MARSPFVLRSMIVDHQPPSLTVLALVLTFAAGCGECSGGDLWADQPPEGEPGQPGQRDGAADSSAAGSAASIPHEVCVHQRRADLGAPVHRQRGGGGFIRLSECTRLTVIEREPDWLLVAFPETEGRTEGWISNRYVMDCGACATGPDAAGASGSDGAEPWPPRPRGMCTVGGATGREEVRASEPPDVAVVGGGARGRPGVRVTAVSYNVWELYDGDGEPAYLTGEAHHGTPAEQFPRRLKLLAKSLSAQEVDVLLLQEVEGAKVACDLAAAAWPGSGWSCSSTHRRRAGAPQNVAVATRLEATARLLEPGDRRAAGPRDSLELSFQDAGGLTVTAVHLKSSRGLQGPDDCGNARLRMGSAAALANRYSGWSSVLIAGDFNMDPLDTGRAIYDRTADILTGRGFVRACPATKGCATATYPSGRKGSAIDLAFFRGGGRWRVADVRVLASAPHRQSTPLGSDHYPLLIELAR